jgi:hypothetical protein
MARADWRKMATAAGASNKLLLLDQLTKVSCFDVISLKPASNDAPRAATNAATTSTTITTPTTSLTKWTREFPRARVLLNMLEGVVANVLSRVFGKYIENLNAERLRVNIVGGNVELLDLRIRKDASVDTDLPFVVQSGNRFLQLTACMNYVCY